MPDKPDTWADLANKMPPELVGVLMAMFISALRVLYDKEETRPMRIVLESLLCGALSLTVTFAIVALGLNINWAVFAGGSIGYFGSATVRVIAMKIIRKKIE